MPKVPHWPVQGLSSPFCLLHQAPESVSVNHSTRNFRDMKTIMRMTWEGVTPDQYEKVRKMVNWEGLPPQGGIFHLAGFHNDALRITDIWESETDFNTFVKDRLMPAVEQVGIKNQPLVELFPAHEIFIPNLKALTVESTLLADMQH